VKLPLSAAIVATLLSSPSALGYSIALVPARGPGDEALLAELDQAVKASLEDHDLVDEASVQTALSELGIDTVETQKEADRLGVKLGVTFVVAPWITPLAGQSRVEILVYFLPEGRAEMLEQIAIEGELGTVVADMIGKLVTKEGLLGAEAEPPAEPAGEPADAQTGGDGEPSDEELLEQIEESPEEKPEAEPKPGFGDPFRVSAALTGGWTLMFNEPATGESADRHGARIGAAIAYVVVKKAGLTVGGDINVYLGRSGYGFGMAPALGLHLPVHRILCLGARLSIGFFKGATGRQRASLLVRAVMLTEVILHDRVFLRFELPSLTLLAFGDKQIPAVGMLGLGAGVGFRF
jgi:hypothetical protein